jgi:excisionase family DNA binding protein
MTDVNDERRTVEATVERSWFSYREAQEYAGIGRTKLWQLVSSDQLRASKIGRSVRISKTSLDEYLEGQSYAEVAGK